MDAKKHLASQWRLYENLRVAKRTRTYKYNLDLIDARVTDFVDSFQSYLREFPCEDRNVHNFDEVFATVSDGNFILALLKYDRKELFNEHLFGANKMILFNPFPFTSHNR
jgi:hypothetical protein